MKLKYLVYIAILIISISLVSAGLFDKKGLLNVPLEVKENLCIDTDAHKTNPEYKRGYVQDLNGIYWDECNTGTDGPDLIERVCHEGKVKDKLVDCPRGCYLGSCVKYSWFKLPKQGYLPASLKFLSFQRFTETRFSENQEETKYELNIFNLVALNEILKDIDIRLKVLEKTEIDVSSFIVRLSKVNELNEGETEILSMAYYKINTQPYRPEEISFADPDLDIFIEENKFDELKEAISSKEEFLEILSEEDVRIVALGDKGKKIKLEWLDL